MDDDETPRLGDGWELRPSARNRAISLSDKPTGTGVSGCGSGIGIGAFRAPSARNRAISLSDNPTGTGVSGCGSGIGVGGIEDRRWRATISASGSSTTNGCCSAKILESCTNSWVYGSKGVTISSGPASLKSAEKIDLGLARLRRRRTKVVILITTKTAATTPTTPPTIAPIFPFRFPCDGEFVVPGGPSALIVCAGTLRKYPSQE